MSIVTAQRLNRFLSEPNWSAGQWDEAEELCAEVESTLADRLATFITPQPYIDSPVAVLDSGLVCTTHPVSAVSALNGVAVTDVAPLPANQWRIQEGRLRWVDMSNVPPLPNPSFSLMTGWSSLGTVPRVASAIGAIQLDYLAGWGDVPALRLAILRKVGVIFLNRHDDTVIARGMDSQEPPPLPSEDWTDAELAPLGRYRNLTAWK